MDFTFVAWWTTVADLCTSNSAVGVSTPLPSSLVNSSLPHGRGLSDVQTQFDASAATQLLAVSLLDWIRTGDSPPLALCIGLSVLAHAACSAPLAVTTSAPIVAVRGLPGALGSVGFVDTVSRRDCRARDLLGATHSY
jgi:hypothetical protein